MDVEPWVHFLHMASASVWVGGGIIMAVVGVQTRRSTDPARLAGFAQLLPFAGLRVLTPAVILVLLTGTPPERPNPGLANRTRVMAAVNVPMRLLLGLPFRTPLGRVLMLISFRGRRTGKQYRQPVSYVPYDGDLLTPGGGRWKLNLREDEPVSANVNGKRVLLRPEFVRDIDEVGRLVGHMLTLNPRAAGFMPFVQDGAVDRDRLEAALSYGFAIVRWHLLE